jgi:deoxyribodipyrimidine photo-lyase
MENRINVFWFRRDLRLDDNHGLFQALNSGLPVKLVFIFDTEIIRNFSSEDIRFSFIFNRLQELQQTLVRYGQSLHIFHSTAAEAFGNMVATWNVHAVFANEDYEPAAIRRDNAIKSALAKKGIDIKLFTDHLIFHPNQVLKPDGKPYTVFTPFGKRWKQRLAENPPAFFDSEKWLRTSSGAINADIQLQKTEGLFLSGATLQAKFPEAKIVQEYAQYRDFPALDATSKVSTLLRFGFISIRKLVQQAMEQSDIYLNELIWREFYMSILFHFPYTVNQSFKKKYDAISWNLNEADFQRWCHGETGYPIVDAGMRQLNATGFMHNRLRMITASFLTKHLLIDWRWGETYFAQKLHDYEQSSNVGGWQWAASTGNDAVPYFRIFNPTLQAKRFDPKNEFVRRWVPEFESPSYPKPMVEHELARKRALEVYGRL